MSSEVERWIATWLDSAFERGYQRVFVTALLLDGHEVLLSTGHNSMEFGKDVITRDRHRRIHAYQLKGNPGSRYSMADWHAGFQQVLQLVNTPVSPALVRKASLNHLPSIVTNGDVTEDVQAAIGQYNQLAALDKPNRNELTIVSRGSLLGLFYKHANSIWPTEIRVEITILRLLSLDSSGCVDIELFCELVRSTLQWSNRPSRRAAAERIAGTCLITSIILSRWVDKGNLYEVARCLGMLLVLFYGYVKKYNVKSPMIDKVILATREWLFDTVNEFSDYIVSRGNEPFVKNSIFSEFAYYHERKMQTIALVGIGLLEKSFRGSSIDELPAAELFRRPLVFPFLSGEYIIPSALVYFWVNDRISGRREGESLLFSILRAILSANSNEDHRLHLPSPYYGLEDTTRSRYRDWLGVPFQPLDRDSFKNQSWFARSIFYMLARRNYKHSCKATWPDLTRFMHRSTVLTDCTEFGFWRSEAVLDSSEVLQLPQKWQDIVERVGQEVFPAIPDNLKDDPVVGLLFCMIAPFRMNTDVVLWLDKRLSKAWY